MFDFKTLSLWGVFDFWYVRVQKMIALGCIWLLVQLWSIGAKLVRRTIGAELVRRTFCNKLVGRTIGNKLVRRTIGAKLVRRTIGAKLVRHGKIVASFRVAFIYRLLRTYTHSEPST